MFGESTLGITKESCEQLQNFMQEKEKYLVGETLDALIKNAKAQHFSLQEGNNLLIVK